MRLSEDRRLAATDCFGPMVRPGMGPYPALLIHDRSDIWFGASAEEGLYDYRMALLAESGDMLMLRNKRVPAFESYLLNVVGLGTPNVLSQECVEQRQIKSTSGEGKCSALLQIAQAALRAGGLCVVPFMGTGHAWKTAYMIAKLSGVAVSVAAPPPNLTKAANDKLWFAAQVADIFGRRSLTKYFPAYGPSALASRVRQLARGSPRVAIKVPNSAGSLGNFVLNSRHLCGLNLSQLRRRLIGILASQGARSTFPLKVEVWEDAVLSSPSVQMWIPLEVEGPPVVEGLLEQNVEGEAAEFVGAARATLPTEWQERLAYEASCLAIFLQHLGYFGRCSFDAIITGKSFGEAVLHWVECNGRWGGVSIPMTLLNRIDRAAQDREIVIVQRNDMNYPPIPFAETLQRLDHLLLKPGRAEEGIVVLTPNVYELGQGAHFMAVGSSLARAKDMTIRAFNSILGVRRPSSSTGSRQARR